MANEERWRSLGREREYEGRPGEHDPRFGGRAGDRDVAREGFWGRGHEDDGYEHRAQREYSREDYGRGGYGEERGIYGGSFSRSGEEGPERAGYGWQRGDYAQATGRSYADKEGRGPGYGNSYRGGYGGSGIGGDDRSRGSHVGRPSQERGFFERAADEVSSWFGDREAERRREQDYRGRGPKGYKRSDERIQEDVNDRLADDPYVDASELEVTVSGGEVTLSGTVDDRQSRRRAEDLAEQVSGVSYVQNNIRVRAIGRAAADNDRLRASGGERVTSGGATTPGISATGTGGVGGGQTGS